MHPDKPIKLKLVVRPSVTLTFSKDEKVEVEEQMQEILLEKSLVSDKTPSHRQMEATTEDVTLSEYTNITFVGRPSETSLRSQVPANKTVSQEQDTQYQSQIKYDKV